VAVRRVGYALTPVTAWIDPGQEAARASCAAARSSRTSICSSGNCCLSGVYHVLPCYFSSSKNRGSLLLTCRCLRFTTQACLRRAFCACLPATQGAAGWKTTQRDAHNVESAYILGYLHMRTSTSILVFIIIFGRVKFYVLPLRFCLIAFHAACRCSRFLFGGLWMS
jgi:hypothetical protein